MPKSLFSSLDPAKAAAHTLWPGLAAPVGTVVLKQSLGHLCLLFGQLIGHGTWRMEKNRYGGFSAVTTRPGSDYGLGSSL